MNIETPKKNMCVVNYKVDVDLKESIPENFYKYMGITKYSVENLNNNEIHFSHPFKLNDIMEGSPQLWDLEEYIEYYVKKTGYSGQQIFKLLTQDFLEDVFTHKGVLCLATEFDNKLFWPHYTSEQGICIEFESSKFLKSFSEESYILLPIDYGIQGRINFKEYIIETENEGKVNVNANLPIIYTLSVKDNIWKYEKEWRLILTRENLGKVSHPLKIIDDKTYEKENLDLTKRNLRYNRDSITKIILSTLFFNNKRFNKVNKDGDIYTYYYRTFDKILFDLFNELLSNYNDRIFQIDKDLDDSNSIISKINYQIQFVESSESHVSFKRLFVK